jgi:hypothetical protein
MGKCTECKKNIGFFKAYRHPTMGRNYYVCKDCFDKVSKSEEQWSEFVKKEFEVIN